VIERGERVLQIPTDWQANKTGAGATPGRASQKPARRLCAGVGAARL
jgi:hypothetical protein